MMDRGLKERLVGAAVLVALAVIFIPMLLDDTPSPYEPITETNIPARPAADDFSSRLIPLIPEDPPAPAPDTAVAEEPQVSEPIAQELPQPEAVEGEPEQPVSPEPPAPAPAAEVAQPGEPAVSAWIVQLGSFSREDNAASLEKKLREAGFAAYVEALEQDGETSYRVRVGPELLRSEADKLRDQIKAQLEVQGIVVRYP